MIQIARKPKSRPIAKEPVKEQPKKRYYHITEFFRTRPDLSPEDKTGFRYYMTGRSYQRSLEDFEKALNEFFNRQR